MSLDKISPKDIDTLRSAGLLTKLTILRKPQGTMIDPVDFMSNAWRTALNTSVDAKLMGRSIHGSFDPRRIGADKQLAQMLVNQSRGLAPPDPTPTENDLIREELAAAITELLPALPNHLRLRLEAALA